MRFKKLKIFVGVAIVLFILIIGNIYLFGFMNNNANNAVTTITSPPIYTVKSPSVTTPQQNTPVIQQQPTVTPPTQPQPTITHNFLTRAS